jgi:lantibiotic modifying enzyme
MRDPVEQRRTPGAMELRADAHRGVSGALFVLARMARASFLELAFADQVRAAASWLKVASLSNNLPGLYFGRAGAAVALAELGSTGVVPHDAALSQWVGAALHGKLDWPDVTHGAAGQGIAALICGRRLHLPALEKAALLCAEYLIATQNTDGSWTMPEGAGGISGEKLTGFAHGVAGIAYFLSEFASRSKHMEADESAHRAARWLLAASNSGPSGSLSWKYSDRHPEIWKWWCHGGPGISLALLRLFERSGEASYADAARRALRAHPADLRSQNLSVCHGLTGLGEIYLEAARVLQEDEWWNRAERIALLLGSLAKPCAGDSVSWIVEDPWTPTADLMIGSAGILHFLLGMYSEGHAGGFPLLVDSGLESAN